MAQTLTVGVALENTAYYFDKLYDYAVPSELTQKALPGVRVLVPFGKGNTKRQGVILTVKQAEEERKLKAITAVLDEQPPVEGDLVKLIPWLKSRTFCTYFDAFRCILPTGYNLKLTQFYSANPEFDEETLGADEKEIYLSLIKSCKFTEREKLLKAFGFQADCDILERMYKKNALMRNVDTVRRLGDLTRKSVRFCVDETEYERISQALTKKQLAVCELLRESGSAGVKELCYFTGVTAAVITALAKRGVVEIYDAEVYRKPNNLKETGKGSETCLTQEQQQAFDALVAQFRQGEKRVSLLYGITGSGKTQVYIKLIQFMLDNNFGAILMVPEIALTPQIVQLFCNHFGNRIAVFHSALSLGERLDEWKRVKRGEAKIVIGTRSAVFAPVKNLGLIVIDEEQEHTYKSEMSPRYNAKEVARFRCDENKALLVFGSATPSLESYARARNGIYTLHTLKNRYAGAVLPKVITVDLCEERANGNRSALSGKLIASLEEAIADGKQAILLMNRRGYNTFASCTACGKVVTCPNCSISLTYHQANGRLMCHYCGYSQPLAEACPECGQKKLRYAGFGTQMIEDELSRLFPQARVLRMDQDTTMRKNAHEKALTQFAQGHYDILLGTQMVAKGIDFENVTLVGVISADQELYNDDFRSLERTFSLLTQVVGRAGRGKNPGQAIVQTMTPENEIIRLAAKQDYDGFYKTEIGLRKMMTYPPFCDLFVIGFSGEDENKVRVVAKLFLQKFKTLAQESYGDLKFIVLGPLQPRVAKICNRHRYRMIIKGKNTARSRALIAELLVDFGKATEFGDVSISADINPESIL
ncbi:MAG TPA: primosomal protein N' [Ruminococcaceae bacterium]|nr:primosomal protein N' [Oscillospiraceae bacterium]